MNPLCFLLLGWPRIGSVRSTAHHSRFAVRHVSSRRRGLSWIHSTHATASQRVNHHTHQRCITHHAQPMWQDQEKLTYTRRISDAWAESELATLPPHIRPFKDETLDLILRKKVFLLQARRGYRCNLDSHVLANFASSTYLLKNQQPNTTSLLPGICRNTKTATHSTIINGHKRPRVLDIGAGSGIVSILFCRRHHASQNNNVQKCQSNVLHMIELQPQLVHRARRNLYLNDLQGNVMEYDVGTGNLPQHLHGAFDVVLINPPFYQPGTRTASKKQERRLAQIESSATFSDFLKAASTACDTANPDAFVAVIHDIEERERIFAGLREAHMEMKSCREMCHHAGASPTRILMELQPVRKSGSQYAPTMKPLVLFKNENEVENTYCDEIENFFESLPYPSLKIGQLRDGEEQEQEND